MENRIAELENRIKKLEAIIESIDFSGDGLNISFSHSPLYAVNISGDGANIDFKDCPMSYCSTGNSDEFDSRQPNDIEPDFSALSEKINKKDK